MRMRINEWCSKSSNALLLLEGLISSACTIQGREAARCPELKQEQAGKHGMQMRQIIQECRRMNAEQGFIVTKAVMPRASPHQEALQYNI